MPKKTPTTIQLNELKIERQRWGADEGKYIATISIQGKDASVQMELPTETADQVLKLAKTALIDAVEKSANDFIFELTTAIPETLKIEGGEG